MEKLAFDNLTPDEKRNIIKELYIAFYSLDGDQTIIIQSLLNSPTRNDPYSLCVRINELWKGTFWNITPGVVSTISWKGLLVDLSEKNAKFEKPIPLYKNTELVDLILKDYKSLRSQFLEERHKNDFEWKDLSPILLSRKKIVLLPILKKFWNNWFGSSRGAIIEVLYCLREWNLIKE